jgi:interferon-induced transmembrane protein
MTAGGQRDEVPPGFGPPAGFPLPGGPKVPGMRGEVATTGALVLAVAAAVLCPPLGIVAVVLALRARSANEHGQVDVARGRRRGAMLLSCIGLPLGLAAWTVCVLWWVPGLMN